MQKKTDEMTEENAKAMKKVKELEDELQRYRDWNGWDEEEEEEDQGKDEERDCLICGKKTTQKYCSRECMAKGETTVYDISQSDSEVTKQPVAEAKVTSTTTPIGGTGSKSSSEPVTAGLTASPIAEPNANSTAVILANQQLAKEANVINVPQFPSAAAFRGYKLDLKKAVAGASVNPTEVFKWMTEIESISYEQVEANDQMYPTLNAKLAAGATRTLHGEFKRKITMLEEECSMKGKMLSGRQIV